jgi:TRAP-type mannitol/chloroaromatic compound transport system permease small subunit|nr:MAG: C4-dicarboxylate ABC transporter permease [Pseudomonadota bacterium]
MRALAGFVRFAEAVNDVVGRTVAYLTLATVLICATVVIIRYVLQTGFVWMQELFIWTHAAAFMLGAGFTLMVNRHVRVDILYETRSPRTRAWLDLLSTIVFLFPWIIVLWYYAWPYVAASWRLGEASPQVGGMPGLYLLKSVILGFCVLMMLQGLAICARSVLVIGGRPDLLPPPRTAE